MWFWCDRENGWTFKFTRVNVPKLRWTLRRPPFPPVVRQLQSSTKEKNIDAFRIQNPFEAYLKKTRYYLTFFKGKNVVLFTVAGFACCLVVSSQWMTFLLSGMLCSLMGLCWTWSTTFISACWRPSEINVWLFNYNSLNFLATSVAFEPLRMFCNMFACEQILLQFNCSLGFYSETAERVCAHAYVRIRMLGHEIADPSSWCDQWLTKVLVISAIYWLCAGNAGPLLLAIKTNLFSLAWPWLNHLFTFPEKKKNVMLDL